MRVMNERKFIIDHALRENLKFQNEQALKIKTRISKKAKILEEEVTSADTNPRRKRH